MSDDPTPPYSRRRTEEIPQDRLTEFRLKQLEDAVSLCSTTSGKVLDALNEMNARLSVGTERFDTTNKRLDSLEGDRRWTVMAIISAFGSLVWHAITSVLHAGPKLMLVAAVPLLAGCWTWGSVRGEACDSPTVGETLGDIGYWFTWGGGLLMGIATLALLASFFPATAVLFSVIRPYLAEAIAIGFASVLVGSSLLWLGAHPWLLGACVVLVLAWFAWRHRARLARLLSRKKVTNG